MKLKKNLVAAALAILVLPAIVFAAKPNPELMGNYLKIQEALAADTTNGVPEAAKAISKQAASPTGQDAAVFAKIRKSADAVAAAKDLKATREEFKALSDAMIAWNKEAKNPGVEVVYCSMAPGSWLQKKGTIANPYYGKSMLTCGEKK